MKNYIKYKYNLFIMKNILVCIPARYKSTRLPGKPLLKINDKTIINHVYDNVKKLKNIDVNNIIVLTDDIRIQEEVKNFKGNCEIINEYCLNGTDRILHYLKKSNKKFDMIVNVQGDEPFTNSKNIQTAIDNFLNKKDEITVCSTLFYKTLDEKSIKSKSRGKIVLDIKGNIMYCSRNVIPSGKNKDIIPIYKYNIHIGIFVFDYNYLVTKYKFNTPIQLREDIEWMKIMEQGYKINAVEVYDHEIGVDTKEDYEYLLQKYEQKK